MDILICEDDPDILELIDLIIKNMQYTTGIAGDVDTLVQLIQKDPPRLIILDYWVGGTKADEIIKIINSYTKLIKVPKILISAINDIEKIGKDLDIQVTIKKPFDITRLQNEVKKLL